VLSLNGFTGAQLTLADETSDEYGPPRLLVVASTSSCVRINLFGIDETLKPEIVTAALSANESPRAPGSIGYLFNLNDDSQFFLSNVRRWITVSRLSSGLLSSDE